jgi:hypothetical protein
VPVGGEAAVGPSPHFGGGDAGYSGEL